MLPVNSRVPVCAVQMSNQPTRRHTCSSSALLQQRSVALLTIREMRPLGEAELMAVLCFAGIHCLGISVKTTTKKNKQCQDRFEVEAVGLIRSHCFLPPSDWNRLRGIFKKQCSGSNPATVRKTELLYVIKGQTE